MRTTTSLLTLFLFPAVVLIGPTSTADAAPIIHEVFYDATGSDSGLVFTELFGEAGVGLDEWTLVGINGGTGLSYRTVDLTGAVFPSDGLLVIAQSTAIGALAYRTRRHRERGLAEWPRCRSVARPDVGRHRCPAVRRRRHQQRRIRHPSPGCPSRVEPLPGSLRNEHRTTTLSISA